MLEEEPKDPNIFGDVFNPTHFYQMRFLTQRLYCKKVPHLTKILGLNHIGLGFIDIETNEQKTIEYSNAPDFVKNESIPDPLPEFNKDTQLYEFKWQRTHQVFQRHKIETEKCRWEEQIIIKTNISGLILNQWMKEFSVPFSENEGRIYKMFGVKFVEDNTTYNGLTSQNCQDFIWQSLQYLQNKLGVKFNGKVVNRNLAFHYIDKKPENENWHPRKLNLKNKDDNLLIYKFYTDKWQIQQRLRNSGKFDLTVNEQQIENIIFEEMKHQQKDEFIEIVQMHGNDYYVFKSNIFPTSWYIVDYQQVPGKEW